MILGLWACWKRLRKQTCSWQSAWSASGCGNIRDCLADGVTAVSATILILSSKMLFEIYWFVSSCHRKSQRNLEACLSHRQAARNQLVKPRDFSFLRGIKKKMKRNQHVKRMGFNGNQKCGCGILCSLPHKKGNRGELKKGLYLHNVCHLLYSQTCRCIYMT